MKEQEYLDVPVAEIAVGDEVKVDGIGVCSVPNYSTSVELYGHGFNEVVYSDSTSVSIRDMWKGQATKTCFRRSSIVAARRRVEKLEETAKSSHNHAWIGNVSVSGFRCGLCGVEAATIDGVIARGTGTCNAQPIEPPKQEPTQRAGEWRCMSGSRVPCEYVVTRPGCPRGYDHYVYHASTSSWSADTRKGQRRQGVLREFKVGETCIRWTKEEVKPTMVRPMGIEVAEYRSLSQGSGGFDHIEHRKQQGDRRAKA